MTLPTCFWADATHLVGICPGFGLQQTVTIAIVMTVLLAFLAAVVYAILKKGL